MKTVDLSLWQMISLYTFLVFPIVLLCYLKIPLLKNLFVSIIRMTAQLFLVGLYLRYLFEFNNLYLNLGWLIFMIIVASFHLTKSTKFSSYRMLLAILLSLVISLTLILTPFVILIIRPQPIYDARYLIPIAGMLLGNSLSGNIISVNQFMSCLAARKKEFQSALCFGATRFEAILPSLREAFQLAIKPTITNMAALGIVTLPGMMTGQLLGGALPLVAIKYQIAIMISILSCCSISIFLTMYFLTFYIFDKRDNIKLN